MENFGRMNVMIEYDDTLCGLEDVFFSMKMPNIQDDLHQFGLVFLAYHMERDVYKDKTKIVLTITLAAFIFLFSTKEISRRVLLFLCILFQLIR